MEAMLCPTPTPTPTPDPRPPTPDPRPPTPDPRPPDPQPPSPDPRRRRKLRSMQTKSGIRLGFTLPPAFIDGPVDIGETARIAQRAEALGFDDVWSIDQVTGRIPIFESMTMLSYVAAVTSTVRLGTAVIVTNTRNPVVFARPS